MTTAYNGRDLLLQIAGAASPTVWNTVGGLRAKSLSINNNPVDITNDGSAGFRELLPAGGVQSFEMTGNGVFTKATADAALFTAALNRTTVYARIISGAGDKFIGSFVVTSYQRTGNFDNAEQFTVTLQSTGTLIYQSS